MSNTSAARLPREARPRLYAACELLLDIVHVMRSQLPTLDLESLYICAIVNESAMRPLLVGPTARPEFIDDPTPPDEVRGKISRNLIADRSGLSRETVRRKVNQLIEIGLLTEAKDGEVRSVRALSTSPMQTIATESFLAVQRYDKRLRSLGCPGVTQ